MPLARASWDGWRALEAETGIQLLTATGGLYLGPAESRPVTGSIRSAREHGLRHEVLEATEIHHRWPVFTPAEGTVGLLEEQAGIIRADRAIEAHLVVAERQEAHLEFGQRVVGWRRAPGGGFEVETADGLVVGTGHLVLSVGPWTTQLMPDLDLPLRVERQSVCWFRPEADPGTIGTDRLPVWVMADGKHDYYGFRHDPELGLKVAIHHSGEHVNPEDVERTVRVADVDRIRGFLRARMPAADGPLASTTVCLYTNAPDEDFVIDRHPAGPGVAFASACSGHGFKFSPLIGQILADLATTGNTRWAIDPFRRDRFGDKG